MTETELSWLAGWLEGEGTFVVTSGKGPNGKRYPRIRVNASSTDRDVLEHVQRISGGIINGPYQGSGRFPNGKPVYIWTLSTHHQCAPLLRALQPLMIAARRKIQVNKALDAIEAYINTPHGRKAL